MRCEDPVLVRYDRLSQINDQLMAVLDADVPGQEMMALLADLKSIKTEIEKTEAENTTDQEIILARLAGAKKMKAQLAAVQKKLEQKSRDLLGQREKYNRALQQALEASAQKKRNRSNGLARSDPNNMQK